MLWADQPPLGALEVGGASAQVSFEFASSGQHPPGGEGRVVKVEVGGESYSVYTHSYLGLGQDEVRRIYNHELHSHELRQGGGEEEEEERSLIIA